METESLLSWVALHPGCVLVPLQVSCDIPMRENAFLNIVFHIKETNTILPPCPRVTWVTEDACHSLIHGGHPIKDSWHIVPLYFSLCFPAEAFSKSFSQRSKVFLIWFLPWKNWDQKEDTKAPQISGLCIHCLPCAILHTTKQLSRCSYVDMVPPSLSVGPL